MRGRTHPSSTKSPGAILDAGALWRRRAKREGRDGPSLKIPLERFWTPERFGDGARSARAGMARVNLTLSANKNQKGSAFELTPDSWTQLSGVFRVQI